MFDVSVEECGLDLLSERREMACQKLLKVLLNSTGFLMIRIDRKKLVNKFKISFCVKRLVSAPEG